MNIKIRKTSKRDWYRFWASIHRNKDKKTFSIVFFKPAQLTYPEVEAIVLEFQKGLNIDDLNNIEESKAHDLRKKYTKYIKTILVI